MKKLLYFAFILLSLSLVVSCSDSDDGDDTEKFDDWNDPKSPNFKPEGYNPIAGEWRNKNVSDQKFIFTSDFQFQEAYSNNKGIWQKPILIANYKINDKEFKTLSDLSIFGGGGTKFTYSLEKEDGKDVLIVENNYKYYRVADFPFEPKYNEKANLTIQELKELYAFTTQNTPVEIDKNYVIRGYVIGNDESGNIYKQLYIQDETGGIYIGIDDNALAAKYKIGQELFIELQGLSIVEYGGELQIGYFGTNVNRIPTDKQESFIFRNRFPDKDNIRPKIVRIDELTDDNVNSLVRINNVTFPEGGKLKFTDGTSTTNRTLKDANGNTIDVRTSNYSTFANDTLPKGIGDIVGILVRYNGNWQFILRSNSTIDDLINFKEVPTDPEEPKEDIIYIETLGSASVIDRPKIADYTGYDNGSPINYEGTGDIRKTAAFNNHVWMGKGEAVFTVKGIDTSDKTNLILSYDLTFNIYADGESANINILKVYYNGTQVTVPSVVLDKDGGYGNKLYNVVLDISSLEMKANSTLEFKASYTDNQLGIRLDNIKIASKE